MKFSLNKAGDLELSEMLSEMLVPAAQLPALVRLVVAKWTPEERAKLAAELSPPVVVVTEPPK